MIVESAMKTFYGSQLDALIQAIQRNITDGWSNDKSSWENCSNNDKVCPSGKVGFLLAGMAGGGRKKKLQLSKLYLFACVKKSVQNAEPNRPQDVIIFVVGRTTYEEARSVALFNAANSGVLFILGGSAILNSKRFLKDMEEALRITQSSASVI
ncbi:hypothetical protein ACFE04_014415 [Oxalis oulophora]